MAVRLPLAALPIVGTVTYAEDNAARAWVVLGLGVAAGLFCAVRWFRLALLCQGWIGGLLTASVLEKVKELRALEASTHVAAGAGELTRQSAAMTAQMLAGVRPEIGAFLLPAGCLLGILAAWMGSRKGPAPHLPP